MKPGTYRIIIFVALALVVFGAIYAVSQIKPAKKAPAAPTPTPVTFTNVSGGEFSLTVEGPIVANELYRSSTITVSASNRTFTAYSTYNNTVLSNTIFDNNSDAYNQFASAMQSAGFAKTTGSTQKEVGSTCPGGKRYIYVFNDGGQTIVNSWASTCGTSKTQTMGGNVPAINALIKAQIPKITSVPGFSQFPF